MVKIGKDTEGMRGKYGQRACEGPAAKVLRFGSKAPENQVTERLTPAFLRKVSMGQNPVKAD